MNIRKYSSLLLVIIMLFSLIIPSGAMAEGTAEAPAASNESSGETPAANGESSDETQPAASEPVDVTEPVIVDATVDDPQKTAEYNSIAVTDDTPAVQVSAEGDNVSANLKITENVSDTVTNDGLSQSIVTNAFSSGSASVDVGGDVLASSKSDASTAIDASSYSSGDTDVKVGGDVTDSSEAGNSTAIDAYSDNGTTDVTVDGNVIASGKTETDIGSTAGIVASSNSGGTTLVNVGGDINASRESSSSNPTHSTAVSAQSHGTGSSTEVSVGGSVTSDAKSTGEGQIDATGISVSPPRYGEGGSTKVTISGDVTTTNSTNSSGNATGIDVSIDINNQTAEITVGGNLTASTELGNGNYSQAKAIDISNHGENSSTTISIEGNVDATAKSTDESRVYAYGAETSTYNENDTVKMHIGGDLTASSESAGGGAQATGMNVTSATLGATDVSVDGNINVTASGGPGKNAGAHATGMSILDGNGGTTNVSVGGNINVSASAESDRSSYGAGVQVESYTETTKTTVDVKGGIDVQSKNGATGISAVSFDGSLIDVSIGNGVSVTTEGSGTHRAVEAVTYDKDSQVNITVTGDVTLNGTVENTHELTESSESETPPTEPYYSTYDAGVAAQVSKGSIISVSIEEGNSVSLINNDVTITEGGETIDAYSDPSGTGVSVSDRKNQEPAANTVTIRVEDTDGNDTYIDDLFDNGNIVGGDAGLQVVLNENSKTSVNVVASGSITGGNAAVLVNKNVTEDNLSLTVWQIVPTETIDQEEHVVVTKEVTDEGYQVPVSTEQTQKIEQNIQYIIKVEPNANATLTTGGTTEYEGYNVAHQGDRITLKVNAADGYYIEGAYNGLGERIPLQYADGVYYIDVPMGGGIYLSARVGKYQEAAPEESSAPAVRVESKGDGLTAITAMESGSRNAISDANKYLKAEERQTMASLPPMQQLLVVMTKAGFGEAAAASGVTMTEEAQKFIDSLNVDLRGAVKVLEKYENGVKVKWYTIEMVFPGNQIARVAFRQLEDGTWEIKML